MTNLHCFCTWWTKIWKNNILTSWTSRHKVNRTGLLTYVPTVILFWVSVPVLSEHMTDVLPRVSTASNFLTKQFFSFICWAVKVKHTCKNEKHPAHILDHTNNIYTWDDVGHPLQLNGYSQEEVHYTPMRSHMLCMSWNAINDIWVSTCMLKVAIRWQRLPFLLGWNGTSAWIAS